jgi:heptosyltransferase-2
MKRNVKSDNRPPDRILVRAVNWVGDTVLVYPAVRQLAEAFPGSRIAVLAPEHLVELWEGFPGVDEVISFRPGKGGRGFLEDLRVSRVLREGRFDLAVIFPRSFRSALQVRMAGIPVRIGYGDEGRSFLLTHAVPRGRKLLEVHRVHYYRALLSGLGGSEEVRPPRIALKDAERQWAQRTLQEPGLLDGRVLIGMNPGATYGLAKCWLPDRFSELGRRLADRTGASILVFGKGSERPLAEEILAGLGGNGVDLVGKTGLLQLAALLDRCRLLVTNDTGTMHVAAAVDTPVVALFGSTDPVTTGPWGEGHTVVRKKVDCSPCLKRVCPTDHRCMNLITVDDVEEAVLRSLEEQRRS